MAKSVAEIQRAARAIASAGGLLHVPMPADLAEREKFEASPLVWSPRFFPDLFYLPIEPLHTSIFEGFERVIRYGGRQAIAAPRKTGKTTMLMLCMLWAILSGKRRFVIYLCENKPMAVSRIKMIQGLIQNAKELPGFYDGLQLAAKALVGRKQAAASQKISNLGGYEIENPLSTDIEWRSNEIVFPRIPSAFRLEPGFDGDGVQEFAIPTKFEPYSGSRIWAGGISGGVRGVIDQYGMPDMVIIDDPSGDEAADSPTVIRKRAKLIKKGLTLLGGLATQLPMIMLATVIEPGDIADEFTDREKQPAWNGLRLKYLDKWPSKAAMLLWDNYIELRKSKGLEDPFARVAHNFYLENRKAMDKGAVLTMPKAYPGSHVVVPPATESKNILADGSEIVASGVQHVFNVIADDGMATLRSEYQNDPEDKYENAVLAVDPEIVAGKINGLKRNQIPAACQMVTAFIDVGHSVLHWMVVGWSLGFGGHITAYGEYPENGKPLFDPDFESLTQGVSNGLDTCIKKILGLVIRRDDDEVIMVDRIMIDCGDPATRQEVFDICRGRKYSCSVLPSRGRAHHKFRLPDEKKNRLFANSYLDTWKGLGRIVIHDACMWRERIQMGIMSPDGTPGALRIWGERQERHTRLAEQLCGERLIEKLVGETGEVYKWYLVPGAGNHWLDCAVGCGVCASVEGMKLPSTDPPRKKKKKKRGGFQAAG